MTVTQATAQRSTRTTRQSVLITGATDGIGLALARLYSERGARLILVGRRALDELAGPLFSANNYCCADLSDSEAADKIADWLDIHGIDRLDLLIHNAGLGFVGDPGRQSEESIRALVAVNLIAPIALTHRLAPRVQAARGAIVFVSSVASVLPGPDYAVYTATKAALDSFVRNLRIELAAQQRPITLTLLHPGATRTGMHAKAGLDPEKTDWRHFPPAETVAARMVELIDRASRRAAVGLTNRLALRAGLLFPGMVDLAVGRGRHAVPQLPLPTEERRHCVITGFADGIGYALARRMGSDGYALTGVDVDEPRGHQVEQELNAAGVDTCFLQADLSKADQVETLATQLADRPPVDLLVHNAGINATGAFLALDLTRQLDVVRVNLLAPLLLTAALLRERRMTRGSDLAFIASLSTFVGYPGATVYAATKDGLAAYARSLKIAVAPEEINVLTVFPGPTRTAHARRHSPDNRREEKRMAPEELAARIARAVAQRRSRLVPGLSNRLFMVAGRIAPRLTEAAMCRTVFAQLLANQRE